MIIIVIVKNILYNIFTQNDLTLDISFNDKDDEESLKIGYESKYIYISAKVNGDFENNTTITIKSSDENISYMIDLNSNNLSILPQFSFIINNINSSYLIFEYQDNIQTLSLSLNQSEYIYKIDGNHLIIFSIHYEPIKIYYPVFVLYFLFQRNKRLTDKLICDISKNNDV